jgi:hypothetical protein
VIGFLKRHFLPVTLGRVDLVFCYSSFRDARVGIRGAKLNSRVVSIGVSSERSELRFFVIERRNVGPMLGHWRSFDSRNVDAAVLAAIVCGCGSNKSYARVFDRFLGSSTNL